MNEDFEGFPRRHREGLISAISAGFFFILIGVIFVTTPDLFDKILDFFGDFKMIPVSNTEIYLPAPDFQRDYTIVFMAAEQFSFALGVFQIIILGFRFVAGSPLSKKAETVSNLVFWLGAGYLISTFLNETTTRTTWFVFWAGIVMLLGLSLIVRAIILAAASTRRAI